MKLLIAGGGGHGRVVADTAEAAGFRTVAFLDDGYPGRRSSAAWPIVGTLADRARLAFSYDAFIAAFGNFELRLQTLAAAAADGCSLPVLVHPRATVSPRATLGPGTVVFAGAVVNVGAVLGVGCIVNTGATIDHDAVLADGVHVCPGAHLAGAVRAGRGAWIGVGAAVRQEITIGAAATVGAGAAVVADVPEGVTVVGVPARVRTPP